MDFQIDKIYNMDCLEGMKRIADGSVDCIITDLPYGVLNKGNEGGKWDSVIPFEPLWEQFKRVTKPNAAIVLFAQGMFTADLMQSNREWWRYNLIWKKGNRCAGFLNANRQPLRNHEDIVVFYQKQPIFNPQKWKGRPNHTHSVHRSVKGNRCYGEHNQMPTIITEWKFPYSIIDVENEHKDFFHPTQKPVDLLRYLILTYSNEGDTILDATIGSGTTAVAALMEKRHFIGFETNKEYFDIAQGRIDQVRRNPTLF